MKIHLLDGYFPFVRSALKLAQVELIFVHYWTLSTRKLIKMIRVVKSACSYMLAGSLRKKTQSYFHFPISLLLFSSVSLPLLTLAAARIHRSK